MLFLSYSFCSYLVPNQLKSTFSQNLHLKDSRKSIFDFKKMISFDANHFYLNFSQIFIKISLIVFAVYFILRIIITKWLLTEDVQAPHGQREINQADYPPFYPNGWLPVLESSALKKSQILPIFAFGNDLVAFRSTAGEVTVLDAYCPHLGAHLGYGGRVMDDTVNCPFHGWVVNQNGDCIHIPANSGQLNGIG